MNENTIQLDQHVLNFDDGIPGFPGCTRFALVEVADDSAFQFLQSLDDPDIGMVVTMPWQFFPDYTPDLSDVEMRELGIERPDDAVVFCPVTLDRPNDMLYVNLLGPFVVNANTRRGRQVVLADSGYPVRAPIKLVEG